MIKYNNPIIKGFNPDPSICRVGRNYYLVTSSFEFFPGVPIYHSKNLVDWKLINYCLTRESQLNLHKCSNSGGIYAPTIRYHDGTFYMITTNVSDMGNFIVSTKDIYGEWSEPIRIDQGGIDPSLLFDKEKVYCCSTGIDKDNVSCIQMCEIDIITGKKLTPSKIISYGCGGRFCEAPHIYIIGSFYYLLLAEGGTEYGHMSTIQRSSSPYGPFEPYPDNPILSHRDVTNTLVQAVGHSDLVEDHEGNWWMVSLGIRQLEDAMLHNLGRETFLSPVYWNEEGWLEVGNKGRTDLCMEGMLPEKPLSLTEDFYDDFKGEELDLNWNFVRNPIKNNYELHPGVMRLIGTDCTLSDSRPTFLGIRQKEFEMTVRTQMSIHELRVGAYAGITAYYNKDYHYDLCVFKEEDGFYIKLMKTVHAFESEAVRIKTDILERLTLEIERGMKFYKFYYQVNDERIYVGKAATAGLATEGTMTMTFTGTYLGIFSVKGNAEFYYFSSVWKK